MKILILLLYSLTLLLSNDFLAIVASKTFPQDTLNAHQIRQIFLKHTHYIHNIKLLPINFQANDPIRKTFEQKILKMGSRQLREYWTKAHYQGKRPPLVQHSQESIIAFIRKVDGSIAYLPSANIPHDLKVLYKVKN